MSIPKITKKSVSGVSLILTLVIAAGASVLILGVLYYTSTQSNLARRVQQYDTSVAAAVAATEKIVTRISSDFQGGGAATVGNNLDSYTGLVPTTLDFTSILDLGSLLNGLPLIGGLIDGGSPSGNDNKDKAKWNRFEFTDAHGQVNRTHVERASDWSYGELNAKFPGLRGYAATYRIVSNTREKNRTQHVVSGVRQDLQIASVPLCQFQYFYVPDLELNPLAAGMRFNGRVHCNANIYAQPSISLDFQNHVTASRKIFHTKHPADPVIRGSGRVNYHGERETGLNTLNMFIGTKAGPNELRQILEAPAALESPSSLLAQERFYNKADLVVVVSNDVVTARSGSYNGGSVKIPWLQTRGIVTRNRDGFHDRREYQDLKVTDVDVARLVANADDLTKLLGRPIRTIWITDLGGSGRRGDRDDDDEGDDKKDRDDDEDGESDRNKDDDDDRGAGASLGGVFARSTVPPGVIRLRNGQTLPATGLTIATPNALYVQGPFNTVNPVPACLAADAITILSANWADANGVRTLSSRVAVNTTVNAAIVTGIVPTSTGAYSGGVENALRLLEDWSGKTLTFNGSMAVLYYSKWADAPWGGPDVYKPPTRAWSYNTKLIEAAQIPPSMPTARTVFRSDWTLIKPKSKA